MFRFAALASIIAAVMLVTPSSVGAATTITANGNGNYQATINVPGTNSGGIDCPPMSIQVSYDPNSHTVGFQHTGGVSGQTTSGTAQADGTGAASFNNSQTGITSHAAGAAGVATPISTAAGLTDSGEGTAAVGCVTYQFEKDDCVYKITLCVTFDKFGTVQSVQTTP